MKITRFIGIIAFMVVTCGIAGASISYARSYGYDSYSLPTFSVGNVELRNTQEFEAEDIGNIEIGYSSENISIYPSGNDKIVIKEYLRDDPQRKETRMVKKGDTLTVESGAWSSSRIGSIGIQSEKIEVYLPDTYQGSLKISATSGDVESEKNLELENLKVATSSGDIDCSSVRAKEVKATATSGNIHFGYAEGNREFSASSGKITINGGEGATDISTTSGDIEVDDAQGDFKGSASSGDIQADFITAANDITVTTTSGNIELVIPEDSSFSYKGSATSGNIETDFDEVLSYNERKNHAEGAYREGTVSICTEASSGNTRIELKE